MSRLVLISGPSCVGKTPLLHALQKFYPDLMQGMKPLVCYHSRKPRPQEREGVDYYFRSRSFIEGLKEKNQYAVMEVRGDLTAIDIKQLKSDLASGDVLFEGNTVAGQMLLTHPLLGKIPKLSIFVSPLSREEIAFFKKEKARVDLKDVVTDLMRRKLLRRTERQKRRLSLPDLENIEVRAKSAFLELRKTFQFDQVVVNHDGEDSDHWAAFYYPIGEARQTMETVARLLQGEPAPRTEQWGQSDV